MSYLVIDTIAKAALILVCLSYKIYNIIFGVFRLKFLIRTILKYGSIVYLKE